MFVAPTNIPPRVDPIGVPLILLIVRSVEPDELDTLAVCEPDLVKNTAEVLAPTYVPTNKVNVSFVVVVLYHNITR